MNEGLRVFKGLLIGILVSLFIILVLVSGVKIVFAADCEPGFDPVRIIPESVSEDTDNPVWKDDEKLRAYVNENIDTWKVKCLPTSMNWYPVAPDRM